LADLVADVLPT